MSTDPPTASDPVGHGAYRPSPGPAEPELGRPDGYRPSPGSPPTGALASGPVLGEVVVDAAGELTLHAERATGTAVARATGTTWLRKVVVTETRTITVQVRREEVEVVHGDARPDDVAVDAFTPRQVSVVLHTEEPVLTLRTVAAERVTLSVQTATGDTAIDATVRREKVQYAGARPRTATVGRGAADRQADAAGGRQWPPRSTTRPRA